MLKEEQNLLDVKRNKSKSSSRNKNKKITEGVKVK